VSVATDLADHLALDSLLWIPAGSPPHKAGTSVSAPGARLAMVRAAASGDPRFDVSTLELERPGASYTVDTVRALRGELPDAELYLVLGVDQLALFETWREPEVILEHARLAVMDRDGRSAADAARCLPDGARAVLVPVRRVDVSSTEVRRRVREGRSITGLVPESVRTIIERERLYSEA